MFHCVNTEGLIDVGMVTSRPRGHPSRLYSDIALYQQCRTGQQSSNLSIDAAVTSSSVERSPSSLSPQGAGSDQDDQHHPYLMADDRNNSILLGGEDSMHEDDDPSLTWTSVEMAAVNQAILSLTGHQPIDIAVGLNLAPVESQQNGVKIEHNGCHDDRLNTPPPPPSSGTET
jgi:hypothetical protein